MKRFTIHASYIMSAPSCTVLQKADLDPVEEFCLLGRSNVGKSSLINHVCNRKKLAATSNTPGKTKAANCFALEIDGLSLRLVDLPGYGYAKASRTDTGLWSRLIADYCSKRTQLRGALLVLDMRHPGLAVDCTAHEWIRGLHLPVLPVCTKSDKITRSNLTRHLRRFNESFHFSEEPLVFSTRDQSGRERFWKRFLAWRDRIGRSGGSGSE